MKVLHWPNSYPDPFNGKIDSIFIQEHILSTRENVRNQVLFLSPLDVKNKKKWHERIDSIEQGIPTTRFYFNKKLNLIFLNYYIRIILMIYFFELIIIKRFYPNILHIHFHQSFFWAKLYSKLFNISIIITEHWSAFLGWPDIGVKRYKNAANAFNYAKRILPVSLKIQKGITAFTKVEIDHKSTIIPNAVNTEVFKYDKSLCNNHDFKSLIFIGRNAEEKDLVTLLQGIALAKEQGVNLILQIVGDGDYYNMQELINQYQLNQEVILHGQQDKLAISKLLNQSDLLLLTSTIENSPCVIGEAHCCGVPVVATNVGGISELIIEGNLFEPKNINQLAEKIIQCLNKPINKEELSIKAARKFGYESIGQQLYNAYSEVCAE